MSADFNLLNRANCSLLGGLARACVCTSRLHIESRVCVSLHYFCFQFAPLRTLCSTESSRPSLFCAVWSEKKWGKIRFFVRFVLILPPAGVIWWSTNAAGNLKIKIPGTWQWIIGATFEFGEKKQIAHRKKSGKTREGREQVLIHFQLKDTNWKRKQALDFTDLFCSFLRP